MRVRQLPPPLPAVASVPQEFERVSDFENSTNARDLAKMGAGSWGAGGGTKVVTPDPVTTTQA